MTNFPYTISNRTVTIWINGTTYMTDRTNANWREIREALNNPATTDAEMIDLLDPTKQAERVMAKLVQLADTIEVKEGQLYFDGNPVDSVLAERVMDMWKEEMDLDPWLLFIKNVYRNPAPWARQELYQWLEHGGMPITPDGCFLAYKKVDANYKDMHTHTFDNSVGAVQEMPREKCDANRANECSAGFHFCSKSYLSSFGGSHTMIVKINPADVVAIPLGYQYSKGRCWRYEVVGELGQDEAFIRNWKPVEDVQAPKEMKERAKKARTKQAKKEEKKARDMAALAQSNVKSINSRFGKIDKALFENWLKEHGSQSGIAKALGVSAGTVQAWKKTLFG